jgi:hypothetical protein
MARIFLENCKLHKILPSSFHEGEFEHIITLHAPDLYPDYFVFPFKKKVSSPNGDTIPDLVFVAKDYADWYVVEVDMAYHSFSSHVEPQMARLASAQYDTVDVINYACAQCTSLDFTKTSQLFHKEPPKLLLILRVIKFITSLTSAILAT